MFGLVLFPLLLQNNVYAASISLDNSSYSLKQAETVAVITGKINGLSGSDNYLSILLIPPKGSKLTVDDGPKITGYNFALSDLGDRGLGLRAMTKLGNDVCNPCDMWLTIGFSKGQALGIWQFELSVNGNDSPFAKGTINVVSSSQADSTGGDSSVTKSDVQSSGTQTQQNPQPSSNKVPILIVTELSTNPKIVTEGKNVHFLIKIKNVGDVPGKNDFIIYVVNSDANFLGVISPTPTIVPPGKTILINETYYSPKTIFGKTQCKHSALSAKH